MRYIDEEKRPEPISTRNIIISVIVHALFFAAILTGFGEFVSHEEENSTPCELTVVIEENLDGDENEPPPIPSDKPPESEPPEPPKPIEPPVVTPDIPPPVEIEKVPEKKKPDPPKKPEEKKPDPPKPTPEELKAQRIKEMQERFKDVKNPPRPRATNGRTGPKTLSDAEIAKLLSQGYRPGEYESLATDEKSRCEALIRNAFYDNWTRPPWTSDLKEMWLKVTFDMSGNVTAYHLTSRSGNVRADQSVERAAQLTRRVAGLSAAYLKNNRQVDIRFKVTPQ